MQVQKPVLRLEQRLRITPQLYQAIKIMSLTLQDLRNTIQEELEKNPALEMIEDNSLVSLDDAERRQSEDIDYFDDASDPGYLRVQDYASRDAKRQFLEGVLTRPESLQEHLIWQLKLQPISIEEYRIGELLIRNLDDNGFHIEPPETLVIKEEIKLIKTVKEMIESFDPQGTCTNDYRESLLVQIKNHSNPYPGSYEVVDKFLEHLEKEKFAYIAKRINRSVQEVRKIRTFIRELDPMPGRNFSTEPSRYVIPDVMVKLKDGEFVIILNDEEFPTLGINPFFTSISDNKERYKEKKLKAFVNSSMQNARWFIKSINQRNETLLKVCRAIIEFQRGFFRKGPKYLIPLTLKDIAREIGVHEATVSRVTNGKYIQTEWGIFELKYFFSNLVQGSGTGGERFSKQGVKQMIKEIIELDGTNKHLTDLKIMEILANRGVKLARRTVAKYRKELDIMSSYYR